MDSMKISAEEETDNDSKTLMTPEIQDTIKESEDKPIDNTKESNINIIKIFQSLLKISIIIICLYVILTEVPNSKQNVDNNKINTSFNNNRTTTTDINDDSKEKEKPKEKEQEKPKEKVKEKPKEGEKEKPEEQEKEKNKEKGKTDTNNDNNNNITNNRGFLNIKTYHKGKYTKYNYTDNIKVYKDLYNDIPYTPIDESNSIIPSVQYSNEDYFKLCDSKKLLDETKYKRIKNPKITAIIAYYNKNKFNLYLPLRSIQNQSFKDIEIIFVDDGSSQNKINEIIEEMKYDNRIILLTHKENKGTLMSRVDGVRYASGEYIILLDQDDMYYDNLVLEKLYKKAKELNSDLIQFATLEYRNNQKSNILGVQTPKNKFITQPELRTTFLNRLGENRLGKCSTRMVWDKFIRRTVYLEAIDDLGDEYLNHRVFLYEDTIMMFELSQVAHSYYFYDFVGYRLNVYLQGKSREATSKNIQVLAMNQLLFIKLLLYKIEPKFDRYHIFKEWGFSRCSAEVMYLSWNDIDLLKEVIEVIDGLERQYKNTAKELLSCVTSIKKKFAIT